MEKLHSLEDRATRFVAAFPLECKAMLVVIQIGDTCFHVHRGTPNEHMRQLAKNYATFVCHDSPDLPEKAQKAFHAMEEAETHLANILANSAPEGSA